MLEKWKPISGYEGIYEISNYGRVRGLTRISISSFRGTCVLKHLQEKILKPVKGAYGYYFIHLYKNGIRKNISIHKTVAKSFLLENVEGLQVNHKDGKKENNAVSNLEFCTVVENMQHAHNIKLINITGERNPKHILTEKNVLDVIARLSRGETQLSIANIYNVSRSCISQIKHRKSWRYLHVGT